MANNRLEDFGSEKKKMDPKKSAAQSGLDPTAEVAWPSSGVLCLIRTSVPVVARTPVRVSSTTVTQLGRALRFWPTKSKLLTFSRPATKAAQQQWRPPRHRLRCRHKTSKRRNLYIHQRNTHGKSKSSRSSSLKFEVMTQVLYELTMQRYPGPFRMPSLSSPSQHSIFFWAPT